MRYLVLLADGMADYPIDKFGGSTPLEAADTPNIDKLAERAYIGVLHTVPENFSVGSDVANLSILGYDPNIFYKGRSSLEAASMGINVSDSDVTFRVNFVTVSEDEDFENKILVDYSAGEISSDDAAELVKVLNDNFKNEFREFFQGVAYRNIMIHRNYKDNCALAPAHNINGQKIKEHLPENKELLSLIEKSHELLRSHPVNTARIKKGLAPANCIWIWGQAEKPKLASFNSQKNLKGAVISAVDLINGIAVCAGMEVINVHGATGNINTNFEGKAKAAIDAFESGFDFVYLHIEAPDECGHQRDADGKKMSIEYIDKRTLAPVIDWLETSGEPFRIMILPDHATPVSSGCHTRDAVPYLIFDSTRNLNLKKLAYSERVNAKLFDKPSYMLIDEFLQGEFDE